MQSQIINNADQAHRENFKQFCISQAEPAWRATLRTLYAAWETWNTTYFNGQMTPPYVLLGTPHYPMAMGTTQTISDFGGTTQITIRHSVVNATHPHLINGTQDPRGLERFLLDIFLHETVHQYCIEVLGKAEEAEKSHGPVFAAECTRVGTMLNLPAVGPARASRRTAGVPSCAQWPINVRPANYYLGAYDPSAAPQRSQTAKTGQTSANDQALIALLQAEIARLENEKQLLNVELASTRNDYARVNAERSKLTTDAQALRQQINTTITDLSRARAERDQALAGQKMYATPSDQAQVALVSILQRYGGSGNGLLTDSKKLGGLLRDLAPDCKLEAQCLSIAVSAGVLVDLTSASWQDPTGEQARRRATQRLVAEWGIALPYAEWTVATWATALAVAGASLAKTA